MSNIIEEMIELSSESIILVQQYSNKFNKYKEARYCFNTIYNHFVICRENLDKYYKFWLEVPVKVESENEIKKILESRERRCIELTKNLFISTISTIEYYIRKIIASEEKHMLSDYIERGRRAFDEFELIYNSLDEQEKIKFRKFRKTLKELPPCDSISKIIQKSKSKGFITEEELKEWEFLLNLRNITVHNNCISSKDLSIEINNRVFELKNNEMMVDKLDVYMYLTNVMVNLFYNWCRKNYELNI